MLWRILAGLVAFALLTTSATAGGVFYRCSMDGKVHSSCCCQDDENPSDGPRVQRETGCCKVEVAGDHHAPATLTAETGPELPSILEPSPRLWVLTTTRPPTHQTPPFVRVRGPPLRAGPPLFVQNCRFLI